MDILLYNSIKEELKTLLNREPTEDEIHNGQTDTYIQQKIQDKTIKDQAVEITNLKK